MNIKNIITEEINTFLLETPDTVHNKSVGDFSWRDENSYPYPFGYYKNIFYLGRIKDWHSDIAESREDENDKYAEFYSDVGEDLEREKYDYPGRVFLKYKVVSLWEYPRTTSIFNKLIKDLCKELYDLENIKITPSKLYIECPVYRTFEAYPTKYLIKYNWNNGIEAQSVIYKASEYGKFLKGIPPR